MSSRRSNKDWIEIKILGDEYTIQSLKGKTFCLNNIAQQRFGSFIVPLPKSKILNKYNCRYKNSHSSQYYSLKKAPTPTKDYLFKFYDAHNLEPKIVITFKH